MPSLLPIQLGAKLTLVASEDSVNSLPVFYRDSFVVTTSSTGTASLASTITVQVNYALEKYLQTTRDLITGVISVSYLDTANSFWVDFGSITAKGSKFFSSNSPAFFRVVIKDSAYVSGDATIVSQAIETQASTASSGGGLTTEEIEALIAAATRDQLVNKGTYNATTNIAYNLAGDAIGGLSNGTGTTGFMYKVIVAGTRNFGAGAVELEVNDLITYSEGVWSVLIHATAPAAGIEANTYNFTNVDGSVGVTITHDSGHPIVAILVLDPLEEGDDLESYLIDEQDPDGNSFTAQWLGTRSGSIVYYTSSDTSGVTAHQETFTNINGETTGVIITHGSGHPIVAMLVLDPLVEGDDLEISLIDEQDPDGNSFTAKWLGVRSGSIVYYA